MYDPFGRSSPFSLMDRQLAELDRQMDVMQQQVGWLQCAVGKPATIVHAGRGRTSVKCSSPTPWAPHCTRLADWQALFYIKTVDRSGMFPCYAKFQVCTVVLPCHVPRACLLIPHACMQVDRDFDSMFSGIRNMESQARQQAEQARQQAAGRGGLSMSNSDSPAC